MKTCGKCKTPKNLADFNKDKTRKDGLFPWCRVCHKAHARAYRMKVGSKEIQRRQKEARRLRRLNDEAQKVYLDRSRLHAIKHRYGLDAEDLLNLTNHQKGKCAICGDTPQKGKTLCVDHNHDTGDTRGLLCQPCNKALGFFRDSPRLLSKAINYLQDPPVQQLRKAGTPCRTQEP